MEHSAIVVRASRACDYLQNHLVDVDRFAACLARVVKPTVVQIGRFDAK